MTVSANRIWRHLSEETRAAACKLYWAEAPGAQKQFLFATLAKAKNLREITVRKTPVERLVNWTAATLSLPDALIDDLLKKYLLGEHRAVIIQFLELLQIPHTEGMIEENFDLATLTTERVQEAARSLLAASDRTGAELYLQYLVLQGEPWTGIEEVLPTAE